MTGKKTGSARRAKRCCHKGIAKPRALARNALNVWRLYERIIHFVPTQIINQDENDVRSVQRFRRDYIGGEARPTDDQKHQPENAVFHAFFFFFLTGSG